MTEKMDHKVVKEQIAETYRAKGYEAETEKHVNGLVVDVLAKNSEKTVIIEVGALNGEDREDKLSSFCDEFRQVPLKNRKTERSYDNRLEGKEEINFTYEKEKFEEIKRLIDSEAIMPERYGKANYVRESLNLLLEHKKQIFNQERDTEEFREYEKKIEKAANNL